MVLVLVLVLPDMAGGSTVRACGVDRCEDGEDTFRGWDTGGMDCCWPTHEVGGGPRRRRCLGGGCVLLGLADWTTAVAQLALNSQSSLRNEYAYMLLNAAFPVDPS
jgi:hypothetical protein